MSEVHKALAEWVDVYKANEVKALMGPDAVQKLLDEYEAERRAREKAETEAKAWRQVAEARNKLLIAYRINSHTRADSALNQIEKAEARLRKLGVLK